MPVKKFKGTLDAPKVSSFTGDLDDAPRGVSPGTKITSIGPVPEDFKPPTTAEQLAQFPEETEQPLLQQTGPQFGREAARAGLPVAGAIAGSTITGGLGLVPLAISALGAGVGATGGELIKQKLETGKTDLADAIGEGGEAALWTAGGGLAFKALGKVAQSAFTEVPKQAQKLARFAKQEGLPLPSAGQPGKLGSIQEIAQQGTIPARLASINDAKKMNAYINRTIANVTQNAKPIDEVAQHGQRFFKNLFSTARESGEEGFKKFIDTAGENTPIPLNHFNLAMNTAIDQMKSVGISGTLMSKLRTMQKAGAPEIPLHMLDQVRKDLGGIARRNTNVHAMVNDLKEGILKDYDEVGAQIGVSVRELAEGAIDKYKKFATLKKEFPQLERFSKEFGERGGMFGSRQWFSELFTEANTKALNEVKKTSPALFRELSESWLSGILSNNTKVQTSLFGKVLDGERLGQHIKQNEKLFNKMLGRDHTKVLKNFSNYVKEIKPALKTEQLGGQEAIQRLGAEITAFKFLPQIAIPHEAASYVLTKALSNPNSTLFKAFLKSYKIGRPGSAAIKSLGVSLEDVMED